MTQKEKAIELIEWAITFGASKEVSKLFATKIVDEIIKHTRSVDTMPPNFQKIDDNTKEYWQEVKQEIENL